MTPAPASGRTADEMRKQIAICLAQEDGWTEAYWLEYRDKAEALLSGPLAPILQEAATARKERDEARALHRWNIDRAHGEVLVCRGLHEKGEDCDRERFVPEERLIAAEQEAATLRARLQDAERALEASGRVPSEPGYSGFAPSPMVSASGEYPSRGQAGMIKRLTKAYRRNDWPTMSDGGKIFALNRMTDALRKVGFGFVALGIEAECQDAQRLDALHESPTPQGGMPEPLATLVPQTQEAGDHEPR